MRSKLWRAVVVAGFVLVPAAEAHDGSHYATVGEYIASVPGIDRSFDVGAYGDMTGHGRRDWAGVVQFSTVPRDNTDDAYWVNMKEQLVILAQGGDGSYTVAARSLAIAAWPNFHFDKVRIAKGSAFFDASSYWHGCGESETLQVKRYAGQWRLIGARFHIGAGINYDDGSHGQDAADFDRNVLTGKVLASITRYNQAPQPRRLHVAPESLLFERIESGPSLGWSRAFDSLLKGLDTGC